MATDPADLKQGTLVETEALERLRFYTDNYDQLFFRGLGGTNEQIVLGTKPYRCRFCDGTPPKCTFRKRAHAVSELLGNKAIKSLYECDACNERFAAFEDDLAKMTLPLRNAGGVIGKKGVPTIVSSSGKTRMEFRDGKMHISHVAGDSSFLVDESTNTITFSYVEQSYRPLGAYKALCKSGFTLLPNDELTNFPELKAWLLEKDVSTKRIYSDGNHLCLQSFVPAFRPFPQAVAALLRRKEQIAAPYMTLFVAFGNVSYQIFLPCPKKDRHLTNKNISLVRYPHIHDLQAWKVNAPISYAHPDLSAAKRTKSRSSKMSWHYDRREKVQHQK